GCFPNVVETIIRVTEAYHARSQAEPVDIVTHLERVRELRSQFGSRTHEGRQTGHRAA
ncbi:(2Fe-2S)-binding protein, partial [Salmonella enterica subsp. enterica serovar Virchow]|nr:(2Fe-2S)-binding protein [Salmonella enterica subsp. enterica serovar Virchow]